MSEKYLPLQSTKRLPRPHLSKCGRGSGRDTLSRPHVISVDVIGLSRPHSLMCGRDSPLGETYHVHSLRKCGRERVFFLFFVNAFYSHLHSCRSFTNHFQYHTTAQYRIPEQLQKTYPINITLLRQQNTKGII